MAATLFQACQDGNLQTVRDILNENKPDIEARDEEGFSALMLASRGGHVDVVQELLASGAKPQSVLDQDLAKSNPQIASMLQSAAQSAEALESGADEPSELADGTIHYNQATAFNGQSAEFQMGQQQHPYGFQPQPAFFEGVPLPDQRGHAHKDSSAANLPPPEVARMIPCKFFPNCRYGDKCIFAHPVSLPPNSGSGPVSPGQGPVFYQPPPSYGYPPYGPPQHFYTMAPPMPMQYAHAGVPMPVHMPPPPHMAGPHQGEGFPAPFQGQPQYFSPSQGTPGYPEGGAPNGTEAASGSDADEPAIKAEDATQTAATKNDNQTEAASTESAKEKDVTIATDGESAKPSHRRQSFNSFLHHHAVPFHPGQLAVPAPQLNGDASAAATSQPQFPRGGKGPRRGGPSMGSGFGRGEFGRRGSERPACHFFARAACKHGEDCRFPHTLPDGTDARGPNAGRSSHSIDSSRAPNRALAARTGRNASTAAQQASSGSTSTPAAPALAENKKAGNTSSAAAQQPNSATDVKTPSAAEPSPVATKSSSNAFNPASNEAKETNNAKTASSAAFTPTASATSNAQPAPAPAAAPIPAKPAVVQTQRANGNQQGSKAHANGGKGASQQQSNNQQHNNNNSSNNNNSGSGNVNQSGRQGPSKSNNNNNRANGHSNSGAAKKVTQRVPNQDDFPALGGAAPAAAPAAAPSTAAPKANFSAILSAPAPVRPKPAATNGANAESQASDKDAGASEKATSSETTTDPEPAASSEGKTAAKKSSVIGSGASAPDFATVAQTKAVAV